MKKINIVTRNEDFSNIINTCPADRYKEYSIYILRTTDHPYRFGISVSKKVGNAVTRNRIKRQIKDIIDKNKYINNFDCIIILKPAVLNLTYIELKNKINESLNKIGIIEGVKQ